MSIKPLFAWYDLWIGAYWDRARWRLYVFPVPMFGMVIDFGHNDSDVASLACIEASQDLSDHDLRDMRDYFEALLINRKAGIR